MPDRTFDTLYCYQGGKQHLFERGSVCIMCGEPNPEYQTEATDGEVQAETKSQAENYPRRDSYGCAVRYRPAYEGPGI
jgi:hypothetical protein